MKEKTECKTDEISNEASKLNEGLSCLLHGWETEAKHRRKNQEEEIKAGNDEHAEKEDLIALLCERHAYELRQVLNAQN